MIYNLALEPYGKWGFLLAFFFAVCGALRLARFFGNSPEFWLNLQQMHDLSKARLESGAAIERDVEAYAGT